MKKHFFFGAIFFLSLTSLISAQTTVNQTNAQTPADEVNEKNSDLVITATVRAKELKMEVVPSPKVEFSGTRERQTVWEAERENLPAEIQPNIVYRDIGVRLRIFSRFSEIQRIVLEAIDEIDPPVAETSQTTKPTSNPTNIQTTVKTPPQQ